MVISVRLDEAERKLVGQLARTMKKSRSDVIRAGIAALAERERQEAKPGSVYERVAHLVGSVKGGPADLSERTGKGFREILKQKARR
jgi:Arc/MetJ-type ribon-helix-helix transcriptional regulator